MSLCVYIEYFLQKVLMVTLELKHQKKSVPLLVNIGLGWRKKSQGNRVSIVIQQIEPTSCNVEIP